MRSLILTGTALSPLLALSAIAPASAQTRVDPTIPPTSAAPPVAIAPGQFRSPLQPTYAPATDIGRVRAESASSSGVTRVDIGGGLMIEEDAPKSRSTVTQDFLAKQAPSSNVYQTIRLLPGANVMSNDPYGLNGGDITLRGLQSTQIGLTVNGVPVNDSGSYALYPQELIDIENLRQVVVSQGSQDLDAPHIGAVGGTISTYMKDPLDTAGGYVNFSYGTNNFIRTFARIETGLIGNTKAYLSISHAQADHFRGVGSDDRNHVEFNAVTTIGNASRIGLTFLYNDAVNNNYAAPTLAQIAQAGGNPRKYNPYTTFYNLPSAFRPGNAPINQSLLVGAPGGTVPSTNYYDLRINPFRNIIASAPSTFSLNDRVSFDVTPYFWYGLGNGGGSSLLYEGSNQFYGVGSQYRLTPRDLNGNGQNRDVLLFSSPSVTETIRPGIYGIVNYTVDDHRLKAGYHFEYANHRQTGPYSYVNNNGQPADSFTGVNNPLLNPDGSQFRFRNQLTSTYTNQVFVGDTWSLLNDRLALDIGLRQAFVTRNVENYIPGINERLSYNRHETLPSAAVRFKINNENQVFASYATGYRVPSNFSLVSGFSTATGLISTQSTAAQQTEENTSFEFGHRYQGGLVTTSVTGFADLFRNRQITTTVVDAGGGLISTNINAGQQINVGVDAEIGLRRFEGFRPYVSAEYLHAENRSNYPVTFTSGGRVIFDQLATKGKVAVKAPEFQAALGLDYDNGTLFWTGALKYIGHQYSTFTNDQQIPHIITADIAIGYRLGDIWMAKGAEVRLNLHNITDEKYLSGVQGFQTSSKAQTGLRGNVIQATGAPTYYVGGGFAAVATLSSAF